MAGNKKTRYSNIRMVKLSERRTCEAHVEVNDCKNGDKVGCSKASRKLQNSPTSVAPGICDAACEDGDVYEQQQQ